MKENLSGSSNRFLSVLDEEGRLAQAQQNDLLTGQIPKVRALLFVDKSITDRLHCHGGYPNTAVSDRIRRFETFSSIDDFCQVHFDIRRLRHRLISSGQQLTEGQFFHTRLVDIRNPRRTIQTDAQGTDVGIA